MVDKVPASSRRLASLSPLPIALLVAALAFCAVHAATPVQQPPGGGVDLPWHLEHMNVIEAWRRGSGSTRRVTLVGARFNRTDNALQSGFNRTLSLPPHVITTGLTGWGLEFGNRASRALAGRSESQSCGIGVAPGVQWAGVLWDPVTNATGSWSTAVNWQRDLTDVFVHLYTLGDALEPWGTAALATAPVLDEAMVNYGKIHVMSTGNADFDGDSNLLGTGSRVIMVSGLLSNGSKAIGVTPGANVLVSAPIGGWESIPGDLIGLDVVDYASHQCGPVDSDHRLAPALVGGVVALMLDVGPNLGVADITYLLAVTAQKTDPEDEGWIENYAGLHWHPWYGFGAVDAGTAVAEAAEHERMSSAGINTISVTTNVNLAVGGGQTVTSTYDVAPHATANIATVVTLSLDGVSGCHRNWNTSLRSPLGTTVQMLRPNARAGVLTADSDAFSGVSISTHAFMGERPNGRWTATWTNEFIVEACQLLSIGHSIGSTQLSLDRTGAPAGGVAHVPSNRPDTCGNGYLDNGEECDPFSGVSDTCSSECVAVEAGEDEDDDDLLNRIREGRLFSAGGIVFLSATVLVALFCVFCVGLPASLEGLKTIPDPSPDSMDRSSSQVGFLGASREDPPSGVAVEALEVEVPEEPVEGGNADAGTEAESTPATESPAAGSEGTGLSAEASSEPVSSPTETETETGAAPASEQEQQRQPGGKVWTSRQ